LRRENLFREMRVKQGRAVDQLRQRVAFYLNPPLSAAA
jgi:hypothetical protein